MTLAIRPVCLLLFSTVASGQGLEFIQANYTKYEYLIPMRDGKKLFTCVYAPKDTSEAYPVMFTRTPYSVAPYGPDNYKENLGPSEIFGRERFIFVYQDVRGRNRSEGEYVNVRPYKPAKNGPSDIDESTDTWDTIDWLTKKVPNHNGRVGMWGISYPGFYTSMGMIDAHPALKAASPQAPIADWFIGDDFRHNGAVFLPHAFNFFARFGRPTYEPATLEPPEFKHGTPDGYDFFLRMGPLANANEKYFKNDVAFWNELLRNNTYTKFWQERNVRPHLKAIKPAVMTVGGWFDAEDLFGALKTYDSVERQSPGTVNMLVMGPWFHGGWAREDGDHLGDVRFGSKTSLFYRENIEFPFFEAHLKGKRAASRLPEAYMFETGTNQWRAHEAWPPRNARRQIFYFGTGGQLSAAAAPPNTEAFDEYLSDPNKPVPFVADTAIGMTREYMVSDQRFASRRTDVLVYETEPLTEDLTAAGPIGVTLHVSTTGTDADWIVKVIDVYPADFPDPKSNPREVRMGNFQQLLRGEPFRGKFRNSFEKPEAFAPGKVAKIEFTMPDINHTFRRGHRLMVHVQSTWFPLVDRNPQKFMNIDEAITTDFQKATNRVYRSAATPSSVTLTVLPQP